MVTTELVKGLSSVFRRRLWHTLYVPQSVTMVLIFACVTDLGAEAAGIKRIGGDRGTLS